MKQIRYFPLIPFLVLLITGCTGISETSYVDNNLKSDEEPESRLQDAEIVIYPGPQSVLPSAHYTMRVNGNPVFVYTTRVLNGETASFAYFDFSGTVRISVDVKSRPKSVLVRPLSYHIKPVIEGNTVSFIISKPANLTLEVDNSYMHALHIFANPPEVNAPAPDDPDVIYFGPGVYDSGPIYVPAHKTVYIAGGAYIRGTLLPGESPRFREPSTGDPVYKEFISSYDSENIRIRGRGVIDMSLLPHHSRFGIWLHNCKQFEIEGIIIQDAPFWHCTASDSTDGKIDNVKVIGHRITGDGIDLINCRNILVENCFVRAGDDAIRAATNNAVDVMKVSENITVKHSVIWNDFASGIGITFNNCRGIRNILFNDIDIIRDFTECYHAGAMSISAGDSGTIENIDFRDIRIEHSRNVLIHLWIGKDFHSLEDSRGSIKNITFSHITYSGTGNPLIKLTGYSPLHRIDHVVFDNCMYRENFLTSITPDIFETGYTSNVVFLKQGIEYSYLQQDIMDDDGKETPPVPVPAVWLSFDDAVAQYTSSGNPVSAKGIKGKGVLCDYRDGYDYLELRNIPQLAEIENNDYTITAWFKPLSIPADNKAVKLPSFGIVMKAGYHIGLSYNKEKQFELFHLVQPNKYMGTMSFHQSCEPGAFYFIAGVVDRKAGILKLYVDGVCAGQYNFTPSAPAQPLAAPWRIGIGDPFNAEYPFPAHGIIDEVRFFNSVLSDEQIVLLYEELKPEQK